MPLFKGVWKKLFTKILNKDRAEIQILFMLSFGIFGMTAFSIYSFINFVVGDFPIAILELVLVIYTAIVTVKTIKNNDLKFASNFGVVPLIVITVHNFISGGFYGTGLLWCYTFPLVATFISGKRKGALLSFYFIMFTFFFYIINKANPLLLPAEFLYGDFYYLMFALTISVVSFMTYIYQAAWDASDKKLLSEQYKLSVSLEELESTKEKLENAIAEVAERNQELTRINKIMINRELRMVELKSMLKKLDNDEANTNNETK